MLCQYCGLVAVFPNGEAGIIILYDTSNSTRVNIILLSMFKNTFITISFHIFPSTNKRCRSGR
jgi:hypothetical protein